MKNWKYDFDPSTREAWLRQIEADLKGKSVQTLYKEWWPGEPLIPFIHADDVKEESIQLPDALFRQPSSIVEHVLTSKGQSKEINSKILRALKFGAQSILLDPGKSKDYFKNEWLAGVILEIISVQVQFNSLTEDEVSKISNLLPAPINARLHRSPSDIPLTKIFTLSKSVAALLSGRISLTYSFSPTGNWIEEASQILSLVLEDLKSWIKLGLPANLFFENCIFRLTADPSYFKQIIQTRTLHLLWQNIKHQYDSVASSSTEHYLEIHIEQNAAELPDHFLIRASMSALAASLASTHALCIHHADTGTTPDYYERINRNIHHLLHYESNMYKGTDPLAGAYAFQYYTRKWTEEIWKRLKLD